MIRFTPAAPNQTVPAVESDERDLARSGESRAHETATASPRRLSITIEEAPARESRDQ